MADGGAGSKDAFRIPSAGEEMTYPFSQFVVRYGHTTRLSTSTAALAGVFAELPPSVEVIFFCGGVEEPRDHGNRMRAAAALALAQIALIRRTEVWVCFVGERKLKIGFKHVLRYNRWSK